MPTTNVELLEGFADQIQDQVEFGDTKASLLLTGDAILLAIIGGLIKMLSGCHGDEFKMSCMDPSVSLVLAVGAALFLSLGVVCALLAARPAKIHDDPPANLFLISHIARTDQERFAKLYIDASPENLIKEMLISIHGKAKFATWKFLMLKRAIDATLVGLALTAAALVAALGGRVLSLPL